MGGPICLFNGRLVLYTDLAEMLSGGQKVKGNAQILEFEYAIDDRLDLVLDHCRCHLGKIIPVADSDSLKPNVPRYDRSQRQIHDVTRQHTNQTYSAPGPNSTK